MKYSHYLEIQGFKRYGNTQHLQIDQPIVLAGPRNCEWAIVILAIDLFRSKPNEKKTAPRSISCYRS